MPSRARSPSLSFRTIHSIVFSPTHHALIGNQAFSRIDDRPRHPNAASLRVGPPARRERASGAGPSSIEKRFALLPDPWLYLYHTLIALHVLSTPPQYHTPVIANPRTGLSSAGAPSSKESANRDSQRQGHWVSSIGISMRRNKVAVLSFSLTNFCLCEIVNEDIFRCPPPSPWQHPRLLQQRLLRHFQVLKPLNGGFRK